MSSFFNVDNKLFSTLGKVWDLILLNLIWMGFCTIWFFILFQFIPQSSAAVGMLLLFLIQGITIGPATTALYYTIVKVVRRERGYILQQFMRSFKLNFKQGAIIGELYMIASYILGIDYQYAKMLTNQGSKFGIIYQAVANAVVIILIVTLVYIFPVLSRFSMKKVSEVFKTALMMGVRHFPYTILLILLLGVSVLGVYIFPPAILLIPAPCCLLMSFLIERVFKKYMPKSEGNSEETGKDEWYLE